MSERSSFQVSEESLATMPADEREAVEALTARVEALHDCLNPIAEPKLVSDCLMDLNACMLLAAIYAQVHGIDPIGFWELAARSLLTAGHYRPLVFAPPPPGSGSTQ